MTNHNDTLDPIDSDYLPLPTLVRALTDDVEQVESTGDLQEHAPTEGRVAEVTAGTRPYDIYIGTGDSWLDVGATLGISAAVQRLESQDLTAADAPAPTSDGVLATHDGSGTPPAGTYVSDPANNQWAGADDLSSGTTISY